jgi:2'-5' RNA ligase
MSDTKERGLWIGLALPKEWSVFGDHPLSKLMTDDAHITLAHLGRTNIESRVQRVLGVVHDVAQELFPLGAEVTGIGLFWRNRGKHTPVALVNSAALFNLRTIICRSLEDRTIPYDIRFGFIPHVTLKEAPKDFTQGWSAPFSFRREHFVLVWGDQRYGL